MSRHKDSGISLALAVVLVTVFCGLGIPLVKALPHKESIVSKYVQPNVMQVTARVYCEYTGGEFVESTFDISGSVTIVPWPHALLEWSNDNSYDTNLCYSEQYGKCAQWPFGTPHERTSYAEITV